MPKQIVTEMQWNEAELSELPIENNFRMRGLETTRLDTLIDAAFAFVLSILVISQSGVPENFSELISGIKSIPALTMSFFVLMLFWLTHREWSRRYGIESKSTILISVSLVFALLIYVYPLRLLFEAMFNALSSGFLPFSFALNTREEVRVFFAFYSSGFLVMCLLVAALYYDAIKRSKMLALNELEYWETRSQLIFWLVTAGIAVVGLILAFVVPVHYIGFAGYIYFSIFALQFAGWLARKRHLANINQ